MTTSSSAASLDAAAVPLDQPDQTNDFKDDKEAWKDEDFLSFNDHTTRRGGSGGKNATNGNKGDDNAPSADDALNDSDMEESTSDDDVEEATEEEEDGTPPWIIPTNHSHHNNNNNRTAVGGGKRSRWDQGNSRTSSSVSNIPHPLTTLHNEIVGFCRLMEPLPEEIQQRQQLQERVTQLIEQQAFAHTSKKKKVQVKVFGSQATGLFLPESDIDLVVLTLPDDDNDNNNNDDHDNDDPDHSHALSDWSPIHRVAAALREHWMAELSYLEVIEQTRVPLVKFTHAPTNISVDISFDQESGPKAAQLMKTYLQALPPLRPLAFVLKYFLAARELNVPYSGGVGSYMLQLLIVAFLQHRERDAVNYQRPSVNNLGAMLLEFLELYGVDFNYLTTGISVRLDGFFFPKGAASRREIFWNPRRPFSCAMENPLEPTMDVGAPSFRVNIVQRAFAVAYRMLLAHLAEPVHPTPSILATILEPTPEMRHRQWLRRRHQPLAAPRSRGGDDDDHRSNSNNRDQKKRDHASSLSSSTSMPSRNQQRNKRRRTR